MIAGTQNKACLCLLTEAEGRQVAQVRFQHVPPEETPRKVVLHTP